MVVLMVKGANSELNIPTMDNFRIYNQATAALLALEAAPLLLSPSMAAWMASSEPKTVSAFETLVARELGFALLLCSFLALLFSGELHRLWDDAENVPGASATAVSPYSSATTIATLLYHLSTGILMYISSTNAQLSGILVAGALAHMMLGVAGLLVLVFANDGKISKRTGADKRTSGFMFKNNAHVQKHS
ncbi:hypothetical protein D6C86_05449 [Aureobasidium pullulans]|uniref:Uncharacterized protein n=1 Tax=Aureobasidium pullulans TaxID=5580 RepID=A0A4S9VAD9_AURPU|nr:hypothetical protein D6D27_10300 [Aureobasidium pullulans]THY74484.1 hypothetical protein D6C94_04908 [Aureobasidium pullulans]THZ47996.1 hypothetical protein D6C87_01095 [Aureobasidium pullulans]THZ59860.1 hypothetical protein D6C86_05449 [Aureobasidium pullulans]THZ92985.1 hypothetical protein D6C88_02922 [Aureobasidium pullulans]